MTTTTSFIRRRSINGMLDHGASVSGKRLGQNAEEYLYFPVGWVL
jgi:hypothetical protein